MRFVKVYYVTEAQMVFTRVDLELLISCALRHYDATCRATALPGREGFLHGFKVKLDSLNRTETEEFVSFRQLDLLAKITERSFDQKDVAFLHAAFQVTMGELNLAGRKVNRL